jgi:hypothetical protein
MNMTQEEGERNLVPTCQPYGIKRKKLSEG